MNKKDICLNNKSFGYYSGFNGLEFKKIEYGINDYVYCVSSAWRGKNKYHKLKVYYDNKDIPYVNLKGKKVPFNEIVMM